MTVALLASELGRTLRLKSSIFKQDFLRNPTFFAELQKLAELL